MCVKLSYVAGLVVSGNRVTFSYVAVISPEVSCTMFRHSFACVCVCALAPPLIRFLSGSYCAGKIMEVESRSKG